jgi:hypothetical protein
MNTVTGCPLGYDGVTCRGIVRTYGCEPFWQGHVQDRRCSDTGYVEQYFSLVLARRAGILLASSSLRSIARHLRVPDVPEEQAPRRFATRWDCRDEPADT